MLTIKPILETERLQIIPLTHSQLINYLQADGSLEEELGLIPLKRKISIELIDSFEKVILPAVGNPSKSIFFSTLWTAIDKEKKAMVGELCFNGEANNYGEVEIRFGAQPLFQNQGYMTEAVGALCYWVFEHTKVSSIAAETHNTNIASQKILLKNRFRAIYEVDKNIRWRLQKEANLAVERA